MIVGAIGLLFVASILHSWYAGNAAARMTQRATGFVMYGSYVLAFSIFLLVLALGLLWVARGFVAAFAGAAIYFLVLPLLTLPLLTALNLVPPREDR